MITPEQIQQHIAQKRQNLLNRRPTWACYEFIGFLDSLQKLGLITVFEAQEHVTSFGEEFYQ